MKNYYLRQQRDKLRKNERMGPVDERNTARQAARVQQLDEIAQLQYVRYLLYENGEGAGGVYRIH